MRQYPWAILLVLLSVLLAGCTVRPIAQEQADGAPAATLRASETTSGAQPAQGRWTRHCWALDTWAGSVEEQLATLPEGACGHVWHWRPGYPTLPACRSVEECAALDVDALAREQPESVVYLLNEPNNPDIEGGGWPVDAATAARELAPVVARLDAAGLTPACCGLYFDRADALDGTGWWEEFTAAGGTQGVAVAHYHIFGLSVWDAMSARRHAEAALGPGLLAVSEAGWCAALKEYVHGIDSPRYIMTAVLWRERGC